MAATEPAGVGEGSGDDDRARRSEAQRVSMGRFVANMASYAISSSLILVIRDNMIIRTNHIVLACLCRPLDPKDARKPHAKMRTRVKTEQEKKRKDTVR
jgi:hypothetical protein